jgi:tetratricopeptide (TPR) repeat protein
MRALLAYFFLFVMAVGGCAQAPHNKAAGTDDLSSLEQQAKDAPADGYLQFRLATEYKRNGKYAEAIEAYKKSYGGSSPVAEHTAWHAIGDAYEMLGQLDAAVSAQKRCVELKPEEAEGYVRLARFYFINKQYDETIAAAKQAISLQSTQAVAYNYLGAALGKKRQYPDALKALQRSADLSPKYASDNYWLMGEFCYEQYAYTEAIGFYTKATQLSPQTPDAYKGAALSFYFLGKYDDAITWINKAVGLITIPGGLGMTFSVKNDYPIVDKVINAAPAEKAGIQAGDSITEIDGNSTRGVSAEAFAESARGEPGTKVVLTIQRAGATLTKTLTREPVILEKGGPYLALRSMAYRHKGDKKNANDDAWRATAINSADPSTRYALGAALLDRGQYDQALKVLSHTKNAGPAQLIEATAYAKLGKIPEALRVYTAINPSDISPKKVPVAKDRDALLAELKPFVKEHRENARAHESKGQYRETLSELSEALKASDGGESREILAESFALVRKNPVLGQIPDEARKYAIRSEVLVKQGNFADGASEIQKAITAAPYIGQLYYNAAFIYAEMNQYHEAIRQMTIYLSSAPDSPHASAGKDEIIRWELMIEKGK